MLCKPPPVLRADATELRMYLRQIAERHHWNEMTFMCIGTDRSSGDAFGPLVGTMLVERGAANVVGTLQEPCDANRLDDAIRLLQESPTQRQRVIVAIDACLGRVESVGTYLLSEGPLLPAKAVGRQFPPVGDYSIAGIVNTTGPKPYWSLQSSSLHLVMQMARLTADAIYEAWHDHNQNERQ